jgi:hypothetical protein
MKVKLTDIASVIRSKNSGPFELTLDIIFKTKELYGQVVGKKIFTKELIAELYKTDVTKVINVIEFTPSNAIKATIERPYPSGALCETDVYGAQQHAPLLELELDL